MQETVGAEEELATEVLPVQLRHFHQHSHGSSVHLVRVFPADYISAVSVFLHLLINLQSRRSGTFKAFVEGSHMKYAAKERVIIFNSITTTLKRQIPALNDFKQLGVARHSAMLWLI